MYRQDPHITEIKWNQMTPLLRRAFPLMPGLHQGPFWTGRGWNWMEPSPLLREIEEKGEAWGRLGTRQLCQLTGDCGHPSYPFSLKQ